MKIVIDIDEDYYELIKHYVKEDHFDFKPYITIANGTPLPKGHGRLIDADALDEKVEKHRKMLKISRYDRDLILHYTDVEMAPTIIEADTGETE